MLGVGEARRRSRSLPLVISNVSAQHLPRIDHRRSRRVDERALAALKAENSRLLREDVAARRTHYRGLPEVVTFNHSDICNLRCIMCQRSLGQGTNRLDERVLEHVVRELFPTAHKAVLTTAGGDPLAVDYEFMIERARSHGVRLDVVTNGMLLTRDVYRKSRGVLDHLNVSLDSHVPSVYEHIRAGASFERVWSNLEAVAHEREREPDGALFSVSAVVMRSNLPHLAQFVEAVARLRPDGIVFQRLLHGEKATPEEEPSTYFEPAEIEQAFDSAERTARRLGMNLFASEFRRAPVLTNPPRAKLPTTIEDRGLCWFLAQNFNVMYTGEVFPCCIPTDLCLGDVHDQDPAEIWNGEPFRRLREQHLSKRGNLFCSGCIHAPHLPAPRDAAALDSAALEAERERRAKDFERASAQRRAAGAHTRRPIFAPHAPTVVARSGGYDVVHDAVRVTTRDERCAAAAVGSASVGPVLALFDGRLEWRDARLAVVRQVEFDAPLRAQRGTCVFPLSHTAALVGHAESGGLVRVDGATMRQVLALSDERAFVRTSGVARAQDGALWVGEYGTFPGARCAHVYRSTDDGHTFEHHGRIESARHVHRILGCRAGAVVVTTGDMAGERRLLTATPAGGLECRVAAWAGFVAACESDHALHFGTELESGNGLVVFRAGLDQPPEFRALPAELDLMVRSLVALDDGTLVALLGMDEDLVERHLVGGPALLASRDDGDTWSTVHRFAADWSDEPDDLVALPGRRVWVVGGAATHVVEFI